jgi:hypothetical protein
MKQLLALATLTAALAAPAASYADATSTFATNGTTATSSGMRGYRISRPASEAFPLGISLETDNSPVFDLSLRSSNTEFGLFSYQLTSTVLRVRNDTGQIALGRSVGTPGSGAHLTLDGGSSSAPLDGLKINNWGDYSGLVLGQQNSTTTWRTKLRLGVTADPNSAAFEIGTDSTNTKTPDWYLQNVKSGHRPITVSDLDADLVKINYGATITGGLTLNGAATLNSPATLNSGATIAGALQHTGSTLGFYNHATTTKPVITGCRSDGTALANLLTALKNMGLIDDQTTP